MKIISKFKDYYDSVAWTWGGGDPKTRYERRDLPESLKIEYRDIMQAMNIYGKLHNKYDTHTLIVGERVYTVFSMSATLGPTKYFIPDETHEIMTASVRPGWVRDFAKGSVYYKSSYVVELCKRVGQPVFWIAHQYYTGGHKWSVKSQHFIEIAKKIPRLCEIRNFAKFYPADQIYQDLSYVIGNLMHEPPDDNPPVQVEEKIRLEKHGFDPKTSFRGK